MKNSLLIFSVLLVLFAWGYDRADAEGSWWDKGLSIFKSMGNGEKEKTSEKPTSAEIGEAFKEALRIGTESVVTKLGAMDGFNADPAIHIPLPEKINKAKRILTKIGMSHLADDLELKLNRAAEAATPKAKDLFLKAISEMTFEDIKNIYNGPEDSATEYFKRKMSPDLKKEMEPIVEDALSKVGAVKTYEEFIGQYKNLPFVPDVKADLTEYTIEKALEGIFYYLAKEEASIRKDPAKQTTALLKKVFGVKE